MRHLLLLAFLSMNLSGTAQVINGYAQVTAIAGNVLTIGTSNETAATFTVGKDVVIMQMQDDVIGGNTTNAATFGDLAGIQQAGRFTVREITAVTRVGPVLTVITLDAAPGITFNLGANSSVQVVTYELLGGGGDYTTVANITALPWNGSLGGVLCLQVGGTLTLAHNITANTAGFRGAAADANNAAGGCDGTTFVANNTNGNYGLKGEGIYRLTNTAWTKAKGKLINGGGGGNNHNGGGGGGGNYTTGGLAGPGWGSSPTCHSGGLGGVSLSGHISGQRIFMGGGGGGGEANNGVSTAGANGGGIVLIRATMMRTLGSCTVRITANGGTAANSGNDGAGGGGAGGTIVIDCGSFNFSATCAPVISANGGNGGSVNSSNHSGGGGGGQGAILFTGAQPTSNVTVQSLNGSGGCNNNSVPCNSPALPGTGTSNGGIIPDAATPLPIELVSFQAIPVGMRVDLRWATASEINNAYFTVERSLDAEVWEPIATLNGAGNSQSLINYSTADDSPLPRTSYYRLRQTDFDGTTTVSDIVPVHFEGEVGTLNVYPNPAQDQVTVIYDAEDGNAVMNIFNDLGQAITLPVRTNEGRSEFDVSALPAGAYVVMLTTNGRVVTHRLVVRH